MPLIRIQGTGPQGPEDEGLEFSDRKFAIFYRDIDSYGHEIRVQESSAADGDFVWVFASDEEGEPKNAHLTVDQAEEVADALMRYVARVRRA